VVLLTGEHERFQSAVDEFFRQPIRICERTFRHLELSYELIGTRTTDRGEAFLARSIQLYPALLFALDRLGIEKERLRDTSATPDLELVEGFLRLRPLETALRMSFYTKGDDKLPLVPSALEVRRTGILRMEDMLLGPLEGRSTHWGLVRYITDALVAAARVAGDQEERSEEDIYDVIAHQLRLIREIDESASDQQFVLSFDGSRYRISPFGVWGAHLLSEQPLPDGSTWLARGNVLEPAGASFSRISLERLEDLINGRAKEVEFQRFFEEHPEYLLAMGPYTRLHPQVVITEDAGNSLIPDFFLEKINSDFCDICDLKRPTSELVRLQRNRHRFRDAVMEAVAQLDTYREWFEDSAHRREFHRRYGLHVFRPNIVVIIGRSNSYYADVERITLESRLPRWVQLSTYDDVAERARYWLKLSRSRGQGSVG